MERQGVSSAEKERKRETWESIGGEKAGRALLPAFEKKNKGKEFAACGSERAVRVTEKYGRDGTCAWNRKQFNDCCSFGLFFFVWSFFTFLQQRPFYSLDYRNASNNETTNLVKGSSTLNGYASFCKASCLYLAHKSSFGDKNQPEKPADSIRVTQWPALRPSGAAQRKPRRKPEDRRAKPKKNE